MFDRPRRWWWWPPSSTRDGRSRSRSRRWWSKASEPVPSGYERALGDLLRDAVRAAAAERQDGARHPHHLPVGEGRADQRRGLLVLRHAARGDDDAPVDRVEVPVRNG